MTVYICLWILNIILCVFTRKIKNGYNIYLVIMMWMLFAVSSLRSNLMGADYVTYINIFLEATDIKRILSVSYWLEKGYGILNWTVRQFTDNYIYLTISVNIIIFGLIYMYIKKHVAPRYYALIIFVFLANPYLYIQSTFNIIRQGCATAIILCSMDFLYEKEWIKYCLVLLLAVQFHTSAYIFFGLIIARSINWTMKKLLAVSGVSVAVNILARNDTFLYRIANLFGYGGYIGRGKSEFNFLIFVLFVFCVVLFFLASYSNLYKNEKEKFFVDIYLLSLSLLPVFVMNDIVYRVYIMFVFISLPAIPVIWNSYKSMGNKKNYYVVTGTYISYYFVLFALFFYQMIKQRNIHYVPFHFFWQR